jgi:hypothetical protein
MGHSLDVPDVAATPVLSTGGAMSDARAEAGSDVIQADWPEIMRVGVLAGDTRYEFGEITDIAKVERRGELYVLDRLASRLSVFDETGQFVTSVGRRGQGPGEFVLARSLSLVGDDQVRVLDPGNGRVSEFVLLGEESLLLNREVTLPLQGAWDMCGLSDDLFVLKYDPAAGGLLHRIDAEGSIRQSFGAPFRNGDDVLSMLTDVGRAICHEDSGSVIVAGVSTPIVRRYTRTGALLWEAEIPGAATPIITRTSRGVRFTAPEGKDFSDIVVSLSISPEGAVLVQFGETFPGMDGNGMGAEVENVTSVFFGLEDGEVLETNNGLPRVDWFSGVNAYSVRTRPFPQVVVYRWQ